MKKLEKVKQVFKGAVLLLMLMAMFTASFITCECVAKTASYMRRGNNLWESMELAAVNVRGRITAAAEGWFEKPDDGIREYPFVNANVSWNCLNKK